MEINPDDHMKISQELDDNMSTNNEEAPILDEAKYQDDWSVSQQYRIDTWGNQIGGGGGGSQIVGMRRGSVQVSSQIWTIASVPSSGVGY